MEKIEIWKDIKDYEGIYKISNTGKVKRLVTKRNKKERILKANKKSNKYLRVSLCKEGKVKTLKIHQLVAVAFLNHTPNNLLVVDHIDNNPLNNNLSNLQIISNRENISKDRKGTSKYTGVYWNKANKKMGCTNNN